MTSSHIKFAGDIQFAGYKSCAYDLQKVFIRPTKLCIRSTKCVYPTYKSCASDLQKFCDPFDGNVNYILTRSTVPVYVGLTN